MAEMCAGRNKGSTTAARTRLNGGCSRSGGVATCAGRIGIATMILACWSDGRVAEAAVPEYPGPGAEAPAASQATSEPRESTGAPTVFANLHGKAIRGPAGEKLGEVADLVVDVSAGEIPYVLVASRLAPGEGYRLRLVPTGALEQARRGTGFMVPFQLGQWRNLESIDAGQLKAGALKAFQSHRQQLARVFGLAQAGAEPSRLLLATHLHGKGLRNGSETIGRLEAILAGSDRRQGLALVRVAHTDDARTFVVPLARLRLPAFQADDFTTSLTRQELESGPAVKIDLTAALSVSTDVGQILAASMLSQSSVTGQEGFVSSPTVPAAGAVGAPVLTPPLEPAPPGGSRDEHLTPAGRSSHEMNTSQVEAALATVREALVRDPSVPVADIQVEILEGRVVLRGTVPSEEVRRRTEEIARRSVPHAPLDNRLTVPAR